ncbi:MAG: glycosyltransferase family 4 protein [Proteobacteria bacterium]|nr:glycosyltransferase family 4 protein [Pseudomonadota bacterium]
MQIHILSFEGPDAYSRAGGLATRVEGLTKALVEQRHEVHLWFVGDPDLPGHERMGDLYLHRWCQWISQYRRGGVYDGEDEKSGDYASSLPPFLLQRVLMPHVLQGGQVLVMAEEWQTVNALLHLSWLLRRARVHSRVTMLWNANNTFGFGRIDWKALTAVASITTVSRYMRHRMSARGIDAAVIPNGLPPDAYLPPHAAGTRALRSAFAGRLVMTKMARWDPDKRWIASVHLAGEMKRRGWKPLLIARGGREAHGHEVLQAARSQGLRIADRKAPPGSGVRGLIGCLKNLQRADLVNLGSHVDPDSRRALFRASDTVLANSSHEPFGLVGLEAMAVGAIATTGCSGEDYAVAGSNAIVLHTSEPEEFIAQYTRVRHDPAHARAMREQGKRTARQFAWQDVVHRNLMPWASLVNAVSSRAEPS